MGLVGFADDGPGKTKVSLAGCVGPEADQTGGIDLGCDVCCAWNGVVGVRRMIDAATSGLGHVASDAIALRTLEARLLSVAVLAFLVEEGGGLLWLWFGVGIVASGAGEGITSDDFAAAGGELFEVAGDTDGVGFGLIPDEEGRKI